MTPAAPSFALLPGAAASPVILHVPHSAREIPAGVRAGIVLDDGALERELDHITDAYTARIAEEAARLAGATPWRFVNRLSRLVVDPERFPDEREEMRAVGMGAVYTRTTRGEVLRGDGLDPEPLVERYFRPYAAAMTEAVRERLAAVGRAVVVDVHSYPTERLPYELHGEGPRPPVCLGTDAFHTPPELLAAARAAFAEIGETGLDSPFAGTYVPLEFHGREPAVSALMVEIRRDTYMSEPGGPAGAGLPRLASALAALVDAVS
ncbi:N-formylglutamate amidohydrolase [Streptomyces sp. NBC_00582]|uniref:N-formylglutamate amidohydrolase n=1 Tax=Streptomyces sp. NBC_00582 TaxID=2975783 RepID=UPI001062FD91|nr:N-formylglutamate amidohydrolase [Streptomyces sp. NBC_00582]WUB60262.1 N-formylglutamate amidohydrolase [Streptomyces sp. NBC_00582]